MTDSIARQCRSLTKADERCSRSALKSGFCTQHDKAVKILMYRKELSKMHERVRRYMAITSDLNKKLHDIEYCDYIKARLIEIGGRDIPFRAILANQFYRKPIEALFNLPIDEVADAYDAILLRRNELVHKHTIDGWGGRRSKSHKSNPFDRLRRRNAC